MRRSIPKSPTPAPRAAPTPTLPADLPPLHGPIRHTSRVAVGRRIQLDSAAVEALRFRQVNVSEAFTLQDSDGGFFRASLLSCGSRGAEAEVYEAMARPPESPLRLSLVCAVLGRQRMIFVSQKATELGVDRILPVFTERSVGPEGLDHEKAHAWPGQAVRASRQCRRATVPEVRPTLPLAEALDGDVWRAAGARFFLDDAAAETARLQPGVRSACLAVGPEGGWTDEEKQLLLAAGAAPLNLGGRVLRAETAVVVGLALLQHRLGDLAREP